MLKELVVEGLGVIERAELEMERGCSALTGETGAGKTLVVAALDLLTGGRSDRALVREGASEARVEGGFVVSASHPAAAAARALGVLDEEGHEEVEIVMSRTVGAGAKGRARINGRLVTIGALAEVGRQLVEIAGQNDPRGIGAPGRQRELLDAFAGAEIVATATELAAAVRNSVRTGRRLEELRAGRRERERELDLLRYETAEIESAGLRIGEAAALGVEVSRLEHAEAIAAGLQRAGETLRREGGAVEALSSAHSDLQDAARRDPGLDGIAGRLEATALEVADIADDLTRAVVAPDPEGLEQARERLAEIARLMRKYGDGRRPADGGESSVLDYLERARARLAELDTADSSIEPLQREHDEVAGRATELARRLSAGRAEAGARLARAMEGLLAELALPGARFEVDLRPRELFEGGAETVEFKIAANPGEARLAVARVASGGELSRIALALHLLTSAPTGRTLIFDEVDAGVGGRAAHAVGRSLAQLARRSGAQVIVVTHLPQVAAFADSHMRITKATRRNRASARVERIGGAGRIDELSRMLAGMPESDRAREHARELLESAGAMR